MATFAELQTRVERNVIDLPSTVAAAIPQLINSAMKTIQTKHNFKVMETLLPATTVLNTRVLVATPANWKEPHGDPWYVEDATGTKHRITWAPSREGFVGVPWWTVDDEQTSFPKFLLQSEPTNDAGGSNIEVWPLPDGASDYSNGEYRVVIPYFRYVAALTGDSSTNWFTVNADQYLEFEATQQAFAIDWDEDRMAIWAQKAKMIYDEILRRDKYFRIAGVRNIVPHWRGANAPMLRR